MPHPQIRGHLIGLVAVVLKPHVCGNVKHTFTHAQFILTEKMFDWVKL